MKTDKTSLIKYDYEIYKNKYNELKDAIDNQKKVDNLSIEKMKDWFQKGIFCRRLNFRESKANFYITTAAISRGIGYNHDYQFGDNYIISYWSNNDYAKTLMEFEIGDISPANGKLDLIGDFKPFEDNLLDVTYQTTSDKIFVKNAKRFLNGDEKNDYSKKKIDISSFFRLKFELASQGVQAKALYDTNNSIIDGAAGTGKSTIAIQKLKYFHENNNKERQLIIIKNGQLKNHFGTLLKDKNINLDIKIKTLSEAFNLDELNSIELVNEEAQNIVKEVNNLIKKRDLESLNKHYNTLLNFIGIDTLKNKLQELINDLNNDININKINQFKDNIKSINFSKDKKIALLEDLKSKVISEKNNSEIKSINEELAKKYADEIKKYTNEIKKKKSDIDKLEGKIYQKLLDNLNKSYELPFLPLDVVDDLILKSKNTLTEEYLEILKWLLSFILFLKEKSNKDKKMDKLRIAEKQEKNLEKISEIQKEIEVTSTELKKKYQNIKKIDSNKFNNIMEKAYFSRQYLKNTKLINYDLTFKTLNIDQKDFDTIIVDEAQDFSKYELELIRIHTKRIILVGDILQNISGTEGLSSWNEILNIDLFKNNDDKINKYNLMHNFRQTYQLANFSYNYRQLLLNDRIKDIGSGYYENEKIFNGHEYEKPTLSYLKNDSQLIDFLEKKIEYISGNYTERFPIIIVYANMEEKSFYMTIFQDLIISDNKKDNTSDIILLSLNDIKGDEFPIVVANISSFTKKELYLIMTRAQFELEFFIKSNKEINPIFYKLINNKEHFEFIRLKNLQINDIKIKSQNITNNFFDKKTLNGNNIQNNASVINNILKHQSGVAQWNDDIDPDILIDEEQYKQDFIEKIKKDITITESQSVKEIIIISKKTIKKDTKQKNDIKFFLYNTYKGYCQICGFTFRKTSDLTNSFEMFHWNDKRVVKKKKSFVSSADSLCLCRNCSANIRWGAFEPLFINKINAINNFKDEKADIIKNTLHHKIDKKTADIFKKHLDFSDMYALEIKINNQDRNIYFTNEHLIQFIAFLQLED